LSLKKINPQESGSKKRRGGKGSTLALIKKPFSSPALLSTKNIISSAPPLT
jgi:hypothetical protein